MMKEFPILVTNATRLFTPTYTYCISKNLAFDLGMIRISLTIFPESTGGNVNSIAL